MPQASPASALKPSAPATIPYPQFLTIQQVAKILQVVPLTVRRLIKSKKLKASHVGRRVRIRPADLDKYLDANPA